MEDMSVEEILEYSLQDDSRARGAIEALLRDVIEAQLIVVVELRTEIERLRVAAGEVTPQRHISNCTLSPHHDGVCEYHEPWERE